MNFRLSLKVTNESITDVRVIVATDNQIENGTRVLLVKIINNKDNIE